MNMNPAERKRKSRQKLREDEGKWEEFLIKERVRNAERRKKRKEVLSQNEEAKALWREKEKLRKRKAREKKKSSNDPVLNQLLTPLGSYKTIRTLRKAVIKTTKALPESPLKQQAVIMELTKYIPKPCQFLEGSSNKKRFIISDEEKNKAQRFYERDDISRAAPGRKDTISIKNKETGIRTHVAKRHMVMSVAEAFALFKEMHPDAKIGKSIFYEMRPKHVRPMSEMPHNVCVCVHHANYNFLVEAVHKVCADFPSTSTELLEQIICDCNNEECMKGVCNNCFGIHDLIPAGLNQDMDVFWKQWTKLENRLQVSTLSGTVQELLEELEEQTPKFKLHVYVKRRQSEAFNAKKLQTTSEVLLLQVDFAENFAILSQDEIQSAHWSHPQVTIFTGCAWAEKGEEKTSYLVISNELSHDKYAVWAFLNTIILNLKTKFHSVEKVYIFSDGCAAQFKNRYTLSNICYSQEEWGIEVEWNFFATSHGKGAMDGVGATAKQALWNAIKTRRQIINSSRDCYNYLLTKSLKGTEVFFVPADDIHANKDRLDSRWSTINAIPTIQKQHYFKAFSKNCLLYALTATSMQEKIILSQEGTLNYSVVYSDSDNEDDISIKPIHQPVEENSNAMDTNANIDKYAVKTGTYILVKLESMGRKMNEFKYLAVSQSAFDENDEIRVMFLKSINSSKNIFRIDEDDVSYIKTTQILNILPDPVMKTSGDRLYYEFSNAVDVLEK